MGSIFGEKMTGPLRIGVRFMYRTKQRTKRAKRSEPISPVKIPKTILKVILLRPIFDEDLEGILVVVVLVVLVLLVSWDSEVGL